ncbi:uncharacterized protein LOC119193315, partial [Manduca sexta]
HTPIEPPSSILHSVYSAIKNTFSTAPSYHEEPLVNQPPPPPQPVPEFKPMGWGAVNSYGEPAMVDAYSDYDPRNTHPPFDYSISKHAVVTHSKGLTPEKMQKIRNNLKKVQVYLNQNERSIEEVPQFTRLESYAKMLKKGQVPFVPTPVVHDNEIGVLPAELLPDPLFTTSSSTTTSTTTTTTTTERPHTTEQNRGKDVKYILRGNKIVQV